MGILGILHNLWKAAVLIVVTTAAYFFAFEVAFGLQLEHPDIVPKAEQWREPASPIALFVGGLVGGFIVFGALIILFRPGKSMGSLVLKVLVGTVLSGILGVVGWALRSSVGAGIWHVFHIFHLTPSWELSPREWYGDEYDYGETSRMYSIYVVWQTRVAAVAAVMLRPMSAPLKSEALHSNPHSAVPGSSAKGRPPAFYKS